MSDKTKIEVRDYNGNPLFYIDTKEEARRKQSMVNMLIAETDDHLARCACRFIKHKKNT